MRFRLVLAMGFVTAVSGCKTGEYFHGSEKPSPAEMCAQLLAHSADQWSTLPTPPLEAAALLESAEATGSGETLWFGAGKNRLAACQYIDSCAADTFIFSRESGEEWKYLPKAGWARICVTG